MDFSTMDNAALTAALAEIEQGLAAATDEALVASLTSVNSAMQPLFAIEAPTTDDAAKVTALAASARAIKDEQKRRAEEVEKASAAFAAARAEFSDESTEDGDGDEAGEGDEPEDTDAEGEGDEPEDTDAEGEGDGEGEDTGEDAAVTASATRPARPLSAKATARAVAAKNKRPVKAANQQVVITAAADIPEVPMGSTLDGMSAVASAAKGRAGGFPAFNLAAAERLAEQNDGNPVLRKFAVASFNIAHDEIKGDGKVERDHNAMKASVDKHNQTLAASMKVALDGRDAPEETIRAAGWCAPSEVLYNWIADFVVDGLKSVPEIPAPRGGLWLTEGPQLLQGTYADATEFGFGGTEQDMIDGYTKTCEVIECPEFEEYRLDFDGYCWKIPLLTEAAYPELIADAMRVSDVAYAHKMNSRTLSDIWNLSGPVKNVNGLGTTVDDTIEALTQIAVAERRWWNIGVNAIMEVTLPQWVLDVFKLDMSRRSGLALNDIATEQKIAAHFANHNLAVEYVADLQDRGRDGTPALGWPETFKVIMYPSGTFVQARKPVVNLSAVYDAASLSENEYTGVFFEQGIKTIKRGYRSHVFNVPICTSGMTGANVILCDDRIVGSL